MTSDSDSGDTAPRVSALLSAPEGLAVSIRDLSGGNGEEPVETIRGFSSIDHANAFARRYVRDSIERCRQRGMTPEEVLATWFNFGEDALVEEAGDNAWFSGSVVKDFAAQKSTDPEERNWRALDPRRDGGEDEDEDGDEAGPADDEDDDA